MTRTLTPRPVRLAWLVLAALLGSACTSSPETLKAKLDEISASDLKDILAELPPTAKSALLPKPYTVVHEYQEFKGDTAIVFQAYAAIAFFYLDPSLNLCQIRKYRFRTTSKIWDRYEVKLVHTPKKYLGGE